MNPSGGKGREMRDAESRRVGFVGLGIMGGRMARRLLANGVGLTVFDVDAAAVRAAADAGAAVAESPRELGAVSDVVITMLPDPRILETVAVGEEGLIEGMAAGGLLVDMATDGMSVVKRLERPLAEKGIRIIDAPVGRGPAEAETGNLFVLMGGRPEDCEEARGLLSLLGSDVHYCGPLGAGQAIKLVNNMVSSTTMAVVAEGYALARRAGADIGLMTRLLPGSAADSWQLRNGLVGKALAGDFSPRFKIALARKDVALAVEMADELGSPSDMGRAALNWYERGMAAGHGDLDRAGIVLTEDPDLLKSR